MLVFSLRGACTHHLHPKRSWNNFTLREHNSHKLRRNRPAPHQYYTANNSVWVNHSKLHSICSRPEPWSLVATLMTLILPLFRSLSLRPSLRWSRLACFHMMRHMVVVVGWWVVLLYRGHHWHEWVSCMWIASQRTMLSCHGQI